MSRKKNKVVTVGKRTGKKRSDMRWTAVDGTIWGSQFEYAVFQSLKAQGIPVRKATAGAGDSPECDTFSYREAVGHSTCDSCGHTGISKHRTYTPDLVLLRPSDSKRKGGDTVRYYAEVKGYLRANKRSLLRAFHKSRQDIDVRYILQRDFRVTKSLSASQWITKFLKSRVTVWNGSLPKDW